MTRAARHTYPAAHSLSTTPSSYSTTRGQSLPAPRRAPTTGCLVAPPFPPHRRHHAGDRHLNLNGDWNNLPAAEGDRSVQTGGRDIRRNTHSAAQHPASGPDRPGHSVRRAARCRRCDRAADPDIAVALAFAALTGRPLDTQRNPSEQLLPAPSALAGGARAWEQPRLCMMAIVHIRDPSATQACYRRKRAEGRSVKEALR
jgi:hypothetical protein